MSDFDFNQPQRQSKIGLLLNFATGLYSLLRNLWVIGVYFLIRDVDRKIIVLAFMGFILVLILLVVYSLLSFLRFRFYISKEKQEFILEKGVFSSDVTSIPFEKIQQVNFKRSVLQRILGVYSLVIDTAGSQDGEVEIRALSQDRAQALADCLLRVRQEPPSVPEEESADVSRLEKQSEEFPEWEHRVSLWSLIKLGMTSNYLRGLGVIIAFYFTLKEQLLLTSAWPQDTELIQGFQSGSFLLILFLLLIGMLVTVADTVIKYYGLQLKKYPHTLQVEMGLKNNTRVGLRAQRVQLIRLRYNPLQKWLGLFQLRISMASSEQEAEKSQVKVPGLAWDTVKAIEGFLVAGQDRNYSEVRPDRIVLWRKFSRGLIPLVLLGGVVYFFDMPGSWTWFLGLGGIYLLFLLVHVYVSYRRLKLVVSQEVLVKYSGSWTYTRERLEIYRLQAVTLRKPLWYRKKNLVHLSFHTAAGDVTFGWVREPQIRPLVNFWLYKIESTSRPWM